MVLFAQSDLQSVIIIILGPGWPVIMASLTLIERRRYQDNRNHINIIVDNNLTKVLKENLLLIKLIEGFKNNVQYSSISLERDSG